jgi:hypothetical protein
MTSESESALWTRSSVSAVGVEMGVSVVVHETEREDTQSLFRPSEAWAMVLMGHLLLLGEGRL